MTDKNSGDLPATVQDNAVTTVKGFSDTDLHGWHQGLKVTQTRVTKFAKIILLTVFGFGTVWGSTAELGGAILASGKVITENRNRVIQSLEGGILSGINVEEGQSVSKGQVIATLDDTQATTRLSSLEIRETILRIQLARRQSEVAGLDRLELPTDIPAAVMSDPRVIETLSSQRSEFQAALDFVRGEIQGLETEISNAQFDIEAQGKVLISLEKQAALFKKELDDFHTLLEKGLVPKRQVFATERQYLSVDARIQETNAVIGQRKGRIKELENQKSQARLRRLAQAEDGAVELQKELNDVAENISQLQGVIIRSELKSPVNGKVLNIYKRTLGAVLRPGETLLEIFPVSDQLRLEVNVRPGDVADIVLGQDVQIQFGNRFSGGGLLEGKLAHLSQDVIITQEDPDGHYLAYVDVNPDQESDQFLPGNQAQIYILTEPKTFFQILAGPLNKLEFNAFKG